MIFLNKKIDHGETAAQLGSAAALNPKDLVFGKLYSQCSNN
jgi:hypothetical protein